MTMLLIIGTGTFITSILWLRALTPLEAQKIKAWGFAGSGRRGFREWRVPPFRVELNEKDSVGEANERQNLRA
jgi:hypothetical protein